MVSLFTITTTILLSILMQSVTDDLLAGAIPGLVIGLVVGGTVWPIMEVPDALGRALVFGIIGAIIMAVFRFYAYVAPLTGGSLTNLQDALLRSGEVEQAIVTSGIWVVGTLFGGMTIGAVTYTAGEAVKGAVLGLIVGAIVGAILQVVLRQLGYASFSTDSTITYYLTLGLLIWGAIISFR